MKTLGDLEYVQPKRLYFRIIVCSDYLARNFTQSSCENSGDEDMLVTIWTNVGIIVDKTVIQFDPKHAPRKFYSLKHYDPEMTIFISN